MYVCVYIYVYAEGALSLQIALIKDISQRNVCLCILTE